MNSGKAVSRAYVAQVAAKSSGLPRSEVSEVLDGAITAIEKTLKRGDEVVFSGFGKFSVSERKSRAGRNPQTGQRIRVAATRIPKFTAGAELRKVLNGQPIRLTRRPFKPNVVEAGAKSSGLSSSDVSKVLDAAITAIEEALKRGDEVVFSGFGKFSVSERGGRTARNPQTGQRIQIKATRIPRFTAGAELKSALKNDKAHRRSPKKPVPSVPAVESPFNEELVRVHRLAHLNDRTIATAVRASPSTVRDWLALRSSPSGERADRVASFVEIVDRLARVMEPAYIPMWLAKPIAALDERRPIDLMAAGKFRPVARLVSSLEYPVAA